MFAVSVVVNGDGVGRGLLSSPDAKLTRFGPFGVFMTRGPVLIRANTRGVVDITWSSSIFLPCASSTAVIFRLSAFLLSRRVSTISASR
jgi:hypothetical protein